MTEKYISNTVIGHQQECYETQRQKDNDCCLM